MVLCMNTPTRRNSKAYTSPVAQNVHVIVHTSLIAKSLSLRFPTKLDTNQPVQLKRLDLEA